MNRKEAVDFLHSKGYSRRLSAKLAAVAIQYDGALAGALAKALEQKLAKSKNVKKEPRLIIKR